MNCLCHRRSSRLQWCNTPALHSHLMHTGLGNIYDVVVVPAAIALNKISISSAFFFRFTNCNSTFSNTKI